MANFAAFAYLVAGVLFILALRGLSGIRRFVRGCVVPLAPGGRQDQRQQDRKHHPPQTPVSPEG